MADKDAQTIDLGDVMIDHLSGGNIPSVQRSGESQRYLGNKGIDLFSDSSSDPIDVAQVLNPQRPLDPTNMAAPTDHGLPPLSSRRRPLSGIVAIHGLRHRLGEIARPLLTVLLLAVLAFLVLVFGPDLWQQWQDAKQSGMETKQRPMSQTVDRINLAAIPTNGQTIKTNNAQEVTGDISPINRQLIVNPYWALPNRLKLETQAVTRLSTAQEANWRFGLSHQYTYQRYRTTREIRQSQIRGAAYLLLEAMEQPKFWTRMEALFGLAEMGLQIDVNTVEKGISGARPSLVANYFRRYLQTRPTAGELYVMRQAIRVVDARARLVIIQVLAQLGGDMNQLYLIAATYDPSASMQAWLGREGNSLQISGLNRQRYQTLMAEYLKGAQNANDSKEMQELRVEELIEVNILNEVQFFQELIDHEEESIAGPEEFNHDGFGGLQ